MGIVIIKTYIESEIKFPEPFNPARRCHRLIIETLFLKRAGDWKMPEMMTKVILAPVVIQEQSQ